ncbi:hypothetical protein BASA50_002537 [Batrachochytrium salamandrivorans]|uniref:HIG1 domain-containing protein n=1 Tax=Batrachochytrium salamandrivorans TaxID=1357716 RepID=A0ABQ8FL39_9FUNG|nr:hypothetical protein BASA62_002027 [Batrachochytrium salamandrivorans]KAH6578397.1 hypothetical protein BASA60_003635 [Batrachochytrium salamandrivorans]KAH6579058.1 hypothetical protein BASA61_010507 [Batrachochytrium salamandrivorans]KAH6600145.1 hypothetical protein BASA50_002537 [Batrachochytrium salamandrivorans]KAH9254768.1 hypothetical protein BASA81_007186 [Batrachochytrium salamandrivorans]
MQAETLWQRTKRKVSENPFVLPAVGLTCFAMYRMVESMFRRDVVAFQKAQRFRIGAQGLAIFVVFSGVWYQQYKHQKTMEIEAAPLEDPLTPTAAGPPPKP